MKTPMTFSRGKAFIRTMLMLSSVAIALSGCVYGPVPYAYGGGPGDGYAPNYTYAPAPSYYAPTYPPDYTYAPAPNYYYAPGYAYGPGYYYGPSIVIGGGRGHGGRR